MNEYGRPRSLFWPLLLIGVGFILLLNTMGIIPGSFWEVFWSMWPLLFVVGGIDGIYRQRTYVSSIVSIGFGLLLLLSTLGYLVINPWNLIIRFWPVFLIGWGLDLLVGRRGWVSTLVGIALGVVLVAGLVWLAVLAPQTWYNMHTQSISQSLEGAQSADVTLDTSTGQLSLSGGTETGMLITGQASLVPGEKVDTSYKMSGGKGTYILKSTGISAMYPGSGSASTWDLKLTTEVPLVNFDTQQLIGEQQLDLSQMTIQKLFAQTLIGRMVLNLPASANLSGEAKVVIGSLIVRIPKGTSVRIQADTGMASISFPSGFQKQGNVYTNAETSSSTPTIDLRVEVPLGSLRVEYAQ